eukprot:gene12144-15252_t
MAAPAAAYLGEPLPSPPTDGISKLEYAPDSDLLVASSWDKTVRVYEAGAGPTSARATIPHPSPVLDVSGWLQVVAGTKQLGSGIQGLLLVVHNG